MSNEFNPYHKWLGIPLKDQPADHYRLLGVVRFESDPDVITGASDQRVHFLRTLQNGDRGKMVDKLLNEIANAKVCLLNKEKKAAYDQKLRAQRGCDVPSAAAPLFETDAEPTAQRRGRSTRTSRRTTKEKAKDEKPTRPLVPIIAAVVVTLLLIGGGLAFFLSSQAEQREAARVAEIVKKEKAAEAERLAQEEAEQKAKEKEDKRKAQEADRRVKEGEQRAQIAEQKLKQVAERKAEEESKRRAQAAAKQKVQAAAERARQQAAWEARQKARREAEAKRKAKEKAQLKVKKSEDSAKNKERADAIALLQAKGLMRGAKGWRPKELSQLLTGMEKEVAQLRPDGLTPAQEKEVRELMNRYYEQKFSEWSRLHKIGLSRAAAEGFEPGATVLPRPESRKHAYLRNHLLAPYRKGETPKMQPDDMMQEDARLAVLQVLTKANPHYLNQANVQRKKKIKQIKTLEKKIRIRIRSLQKEPEVQVALETLGSKFDPRFAPK